MYLYIHTYIELFLYLESGLPKGLGFCNPTVLAELAQQLPQTWVRSTVRIYKHACISSSLRRWMTYSSLKSHKGIESASEACKACRQCISVLARLLSTMQLLRRYLLDASWLSASVHSVCRLCMFDRRPWEWVKPKPTFYST